MEIALIMGDTELKTLQRYANFRPAILASKPDGETHTSVSTLTAGKHWSISG